jgi:alkanesulfonate monooxygenase SsuD/methylene tetrahydromethanopterin reductase-like flavin-dependent oxidoreductase (luciferase family)
MRFILAAPSNSPADWPLLQKAAIEAEELGFWGFLLPDHFMGGENFGGDSTLDTWLALSYLATLTDRIHLGSLVTPAGLRPPSILAKMVSTLDVLTDGRTVLGIGAGSSQSEFEAYSLWDTAGVRVEKTAEAVQLVLRLWTERTVDFAGKYFRAKGAVLEPKPRQKPHPPLIFGGIGPRMLQIAGRYADICLIPISETDSAIAMEEVMRGARARQRNGKIAFAGAAESLPQPWRDYDRGRYLERTELAGELGFEYVIVPLPWKNYLEALGDFARNVMPLMQPESLFTTLRANS